MQLTEYLKHNTVYLDGGMGTLLQQRGLRAGEASECWNLSHPEEITAIHMLPGYTHNIINLSETENLVTVMWANEQFDPAHPDTFFEVVE